MLQSDKFSMKFNSLKDELLHAIRETINEEEYNDEGFVEFGEDGFEDEAQNDLIGVNTENVAFGDMCGDICEYPLEDLGYPDALEVLRILENK
jgi:hypothetical protein